MSTRFRLMSLLRSVVLLSMLAIGMPALAAHAADGVQALATDKGPLTLHPIHHASFVMDWNGRTIYVDPVGDASLYKNLGAPDVVLITHAHGDHLDTDTLAALDTDAAVMVMPQSVADKLDKSYGASRLIMANGDTTESNGFEIHAMPMYNCRRRLNHVIRKAGAMAMCSPWAASGSIFPAIPKARSRCAGCRISIWRSCA